AAEWDGEPGTFIAALRQLRFLDGGEGSYLIHDWADHNPWVVNRPKRIELARAAAMTRWNGRSMRDACKPHASRIEPQCGPHESAMPTSPPLSTPRLTPVKQNGASAPADWIPTEAWAGFIEMRKKIRGPLTDRAVALIVTELEKLRASGEDPGAVLDQS